MAHKKAGGSTRLGRDSKSKRLGVKVFGGQIAEAGSIILRQRGQKYRGGENVLVSKDYTLHASVTGTVKFATAKKELFTGQLKSARIVSVLPLEKKVAKKDAIKLVDKKVETVATQEAVVEKKPRVRVKKETGK